MKVFDRIVESANIQKEIEKFVKKNSYLDFEGKSGNEMRFSTRENGDVGEGRASRKDYSEAKKLETLLKKKFEKQIKYMQVEIIDEWVSIVIEV